MAEGLSQYIGIKVANQSWQKGQEMAASLQVLFECHTLPRSGSPVPNCQRLGIQEGKEVVLDVVLCRSG